MSVIDDYLKAKAAYREASPAWLEDSEPLVVAMSEAAIALADHFCDETGLSAELVAKIEGAIEYRYKTDFEEFVQYTFESAGDYRNSVGVRFRANDELIHVDVNGKSVDGVGTLGALRRLLSALGGEG